MAGTLRSFAQAPRVYRAHRSFQIRLFLVGCFSRSSIAFCSSSPLSPISGDAAGEQSERIFRAALTDYWGGGCPITGHQRPRLAARLSHRTVVRVRGRAAARYDNGLLLSALWDAAFFADDGGILASPTLSEGALSALDLKSALRLFNLRKSHRAHFRRAPRAPIINS